MNWIPLKTETQLAEIKSNSHYSIIFKHSTRCSISIMAKKKIELTWDELPKDTKMYFLDLLMYRPISNQIASDFLVAHQSPQVLLIKNGDCVLEQSHGDISVNEINEVISQTA
ncbi:MAG: bacillithiol system redox-active protein YtxJ [Sphingobacteriales bacterium]|nr:MAG: bacillithiol system redox-active protein YtxJ [Sphingobacteriales bacterium]TAF82818.1 MAG: bacillithiol system redox-active protein YtxJ [Sphingobacteriales bacterium]